MLGKMSTIDKLSLTLRQEVYAVRSYTESIRLLSDNRAGHRLAISLLNEKLNYHKGRVVVLRKQLEAYKKGRI